MKEPVQALKQDDVLSQVTYARERIALVKSNDVSCAAVAANEAALFCQFNMDELRGVNGAAAHATGYA